MYGKKPQSLLIREMSAFVVATALVLPSYAAAFCVGDCDGDGRVTVAEALAGVRIALGSGSAGSCPNADRSGDSVVSIDELVRAVRAALDGCVPRTFTATRTPTPTPSATVTPTVVGVTGTWEGTWQSDSGSGGGTLSATLLQTGSSANGSAVFTGSPCFLDGLVTGGMSGTKWTAVFTTAGGGRIDLTGTWRGERMDGTYLVRSSGPCKGDRGTFFVERVPVVAVLASSVQFVPEAYQTGVDLRSRLLPRAAGLVFNDGSDAPVKLLEPGGTIRPLARRMGVPASPVLSGAGLFWVDLRSGFSPSGCAGAGVDLYVQRTSLADGATTTLARGDNCSPHGVDLVVDQTHVYWVSSSSSQWALRMTPLVGGPSQTLVASPLPIFHLGRDAGYLYWQDGDSPDPERSVSIRRMPLGGGPASLVYDAGGRLLEGGFVVHGGHVYFGEQSFPPAHRVARVAVTGGEAEVLAASPGAARRFAADGSWVYWVDATSLHAVDPASGDDSILADQLVSPVDVAAADGRVVWAESVCCAHGQKGSVRQIDGDGPVQTLAENTDAPGFVAADASHTYWTEGGDIGGIEGFARIARAPRAGGAVTTVAMGVSTALPPVAADESAAYVADRFTIKRFPFDGGTAEKLSAADFYVQDLVTDGQHVYWIEDPFSLVRRVAVSGGEVVDLAAGSGPAGRVALDDAHVYWIDHWDTIRRIAKTGGAATTIAAGLPFLSDLAADGIRVYFSEQDSGEIRSVPAAGGGISVVGQGDPFSWNLLAVEGPALFAIGQTALRKFATSGGAAVLLARDLESEVGFPNGVAADAGRVYWSETAGGTIKATQRN